MSTPPYDAYPAPASGPYEQPGPDVVAPPPAAVGAAAPEDVGGYDRPAVDHGVIASVADEGHPAVDHGRVDDFPTATGVPAHPSPAPLGDDGLAPRPTAPRWATMSYTSFDRPGEGGGWQVKDRHGELTEAEVTALRDAVQTHLDDGTELPAFPDEEQVARLPRRMCHLALGADASAIWHSAPAGMDASGRPGNVFAHLVLDRRRTAAEPTPRPIDRWRHADWATPFGPDAVRGTTIRAEPPGAGPMIDTAQTVAFLADPVTWRIGVFSVLLDACAAAVGGGVPVVLGCADTDTAARWVGAVTRLMSPVWARRFGFSTLERAGTLSGFFGRGGHLACVPVADLSEPLPGPWIALAEDEAVALGDLDGEPHRTAAGQRIAVTAWSGLMQAMLTDPEAAEAALVDADRIAAVTHDADRPDDADPLAPLALAAVTHPGRYPDATAPAARLLAAGAPAGLDGEEGLAAAVETAIADHLPPGAEAVHRIWADARGRGRSGAALAALYRRRAVADPGWLVTDTARRPEPEVADPELDEATREAVIGTADTLTTRAADDLLSAALGAVALIHLTGSAIAADDPAGERLRRLLADVVVYGLARHSREFCSNVTPSPELTRQLLDHLAEDRSWRGRPVGARLPPEVLDWLLPGEVDRDLPDGSFPEAPGEIDGATALRGEAAAQRWPADPWLTPLAVWVTLAEGGGPADIEAMVDHEWPVGALRDLQTRLGDRLPPTSWPATLQATPDSPELDLVCRELGGAQPGRYDAHHPTVDLAALRLLDANWPQRTELPDVIDTISRAIGVIRFDAPLDASVVGRLHTAMLIAVIDPGLLRPGTGQRLSGLSDWLARPVVVADEVVATGTAHVRSHGDAATLAGRLARADPVFGSLETVPICWLDQVRAGSDEEPVVRACLRAALADADPALRSRVTETVREAVRTPGEDTREVDRAVRVWLSELIGAPERRRGLFGGAR